MNRPTAVIPLRDGRHGKSRLAPGFDEGRRAAMIATMGRHVADVALASPSVGGVLVVTRDVAYVEGLLADRDVTVIAQPETVLGLNGALSLGRTWAMADPGSNGMLVLHADLPLLAVEDIEEIVDQAASPGDLVIAADRHHVGTNALLMRWERSDPATMRRADAFRFRFGEDSFRAHLAEAANAGFTPAIVLQPGTELDLDTLGDWNLLPAYLRRSLDLAPPPLDRRATHVATLTL
ncbi:MAG TPA: 2-phospho-L-lactate guanylyltransferase [Thermomicrobiales bacterium]|nr:2-phospho-L-lactate guanylyltransferase [Thermomicrobiales bacterium]